MGLITLPLLWYWWSSDVTSKIYTAVKLIQCCCCGQIWLAVFVSPTHNKHHCHLWAKLEKLIIFSSYPLWLTPNFSVLWHAFSRSLTLSLFLSNASAVSFRSLFTRVLFDFSSIISTKFQQNGSYACTRVCFFENYYSKIISKFIWNSLARVYPNQHCHTVAVFQV